MGVRVDSVPGASVPTYSWPLQIGVRESCCAFPTLGIETASVNWADAARSLIEICPSCAPKFSPMSAVPHSNVGLGSWGLTQGPRRSPAFVHRQKQNGCGRCIDVGRWDSIRIGKEL